MSFYQFPRKIYFQRDIIDDLHTILEKNRISRVLIVTDKVVFGRFREKLLKGLSGIDYELFDNVEPEPSIDSIEDVFQNLGNRKFEAILAFGGGSVMDFAKSLAIKISYPEKKLDEVNPFEPLELKTILIAVPTTSGTGSDVSFGIVLTQGNRKLALGNFDLVPFIDILDPSLAPSNREIIVPTGIDALVHSFESIASNNSSPLTDALAEKSIELIFENLEGSISGKDESRDKMHLAATMAGLAFSNSGTALAHALGHSFGATFMITHGTSVGLFLVPAMKFNATDENTLKKYEKVGKMLGAKSFNDLIDEIYSLFDRVGQPKKVSQLNISRKIYESRLDQMISKAMSDSEIAFNPVIPGEEDIMRIFLENY